MVIFRGSELELKWRVAAHELMLIGIDSGTWFGFEDDLAKTSFSL